MNSQDSEATTNAFTTTQAINSRRDQLMVTVRNYQDEVNTQKAKQASILDECIINKAEISEAILQKDNSLMASLFSDLNDSDVKHAKGASLLKTGELQLANSLALLEAQEIKVKTNSFSAPKPQIPSTPYKGRISRYETPANPANPASGVHNIASSIQGAMPPSPSTTSHPSSLLDTRRALTPMDKADNYLMRQIAKSYVFYEYFDDEDPKNAILENHCDSVDRQVI
jgi:hypothetical protein